MKTVQRLSDDNALRRFNLETKSPLSLAYINSNHNWVAYDYDAEIFNNSAITITGNNYYYGTHYVLETSLVEEHVSEPIVLRLSVNDIFEADDEDQPFVFTCAIYSEINSITVNAQFYDINGTSVDGNSRTIQGGTWGAVRSNRLDLTPEASGSTNYCVVLTITNHGGAIRLSTPNVVNDLAWANSPVIQSMRPYIPQFYETYDRREEDPNYPFFRYVEVMTDAIADTMKLYSEWFKYDRREIPASYPTNTYETKSRLVDYQYVRDENLDWLAQFSGNKIKKQIYVAGSPIITDTDSFKAWQLYPAGYGRNAGTQSALREAVQFVLSGDKTVIISQRYNNDPWAIKIVTKVSETPGNLDVRQSVRVATTANVNLASGLAAGNTIDGITLNEGNRVLVKNQTTGSQNGVYVCPASGAASRAADFDSVSPTEVASGALFIVSEGSVNAGDAFILVTPPTITLGSTTLTFLEWPGSSAVLAAAEPARPLGYSLTHKIIEQAKFTLGDSTYGLLGEPSSIL